ncbi:MAG TPA: hypothetical protein VFB66_01135 [Tepidisphaeraceae bacterium]|nr:hypothetical protein [Tepidisphaeraceae bacterium]
MTLYIAGIPPWYSAVPRGGQLFDQEEEDSVAGRKSGGAKQGAG